MCIKVIFAWYDFWVGLYYDKARKRLYILPIPCFGIYIQLAEALKEVKDAKTLKEVGEWLEKKMVAIPLGSIEWHIRLDEVEALKHGEMPVNMGNRED